MRLRLRCEGRRMYGMGGDEDGQGGWTHPPSPVEDAAGVSDETKEAVEVKREVTVEYDERPCTVEDNAAKVCPRVLVHYHYYDQKRLAMTGTRGGRSRRVCTGELMGNSQARASRPNAATRTAETRRRSSSKATGRPKPRRVVVHARAVHERNGTRNQKSQNTKPVSTWIWKGPRPSNVADRAAALRCAATMPCADGRRARGAPNLSTPHGQRSSAQARQTCREGCRRPWIQRFTFRKPTQQRTSPRPGSEWPGQEEGHGTERMAVGFK